MIGGIALGSQALEPSSTSLLEAGGAGIAIHMMLSVIFGASVAAVAGLVAPIRSSTVALIAWTSLAGLALWLVNFYVIAPIGGWRWFPEAADDRVTWSYDHADSPWHVAFTPGIRALDVVGGDGEVLLRDGRPTRVDVDEVRAKAAEAAQRLFERL